MMYAGDEVYGDDITSGLSSEYRGSPRVPKANRGWEPGTFEAAPKPRTEICPECNEPIIDGQALCHKVGCRSNQEVEF